MIRYVCITVIVCLGLAPLHKFTRRVLADEMAAVLLIAHVPYDYAVGLSNIAQKRNYYF